MIRNLKGSIYGRSSINIVHSSNGFKGEESKKSANQKQESPVAAMLVNGSGQNEQCL
jgi:hypothetical protein